MTQDHQILVHELALYLTIIVVVACAGMTIVGSIAFWRSGAGQAKTFSLLIERGQVLQMSTVILIIMAVCGLRILDDISNEATVSILSGVAGYVLGGRTRSFSKSNDDDQK